MRKAIMSFCALLPVMATAQSHPVCMAAGEMDAALVDWHGERVISASADGSLALWRNTQTGSWTLVQYDRSGEACALEAGETSPPVINDADLLAQLMP